MFQFQSFTIPSLYRPWILYCCHWEEPHISKSPNMLYFALHFSAHFSAFPISRVGILFIVITCLRDKRFGLVCITYVWWRMIDYSSFQTFAAIWILYIFFWVFPRRQIVFGQLQFDAGEIPRRKYTAINLYCTRNAYTISLKSQHCNFMLISFMYFRILMPIPVAARSKA